MAWQEQSIMRLRAEFVAMASVEGANVADRCRRYGISRKTGSKWLHRAATEGAAGLADRPPGPRVSPARTPPVGEAQVLAAREAHPTWGGRKLHHSLRRQGMLTVPAPRTITAILQRHDRIDPAASHPPWQRFEHAAPNELGQLDFLGHLPLAVGRVHPVTLLDDHSRFALGLFACPHERQDLVQAHLTTCFRRYGLPHAILTDNGPPWGTSGAGGVTAVEAWLLRLGVALWHGRAYHPQTQGKIERFHRTIQAEAIGPRPLPDLTTAQAVVAAVRDGYNLERPHAALAFATPASRYQPSARPFPAVLPSLVYGPDDETRIGRATGVISFRGRHHFVGRGLAGLTVAVRPTLTPRHFTVLFCHHVVGVLDVPETSEV